MPPAALTCEAAGARILECALRALVWVRTPEPSMSLRPLSLSPVGREHMLLARLTALLDDFARYLVYVHRMVMATIALRFLC